ncbi:hypothetical protein BDW02DRAFT_523995, partial [Decorospora gaudefroyi]
MGGNTEYIAGHGYLSLSQAVHVAQNSEGGVDQRLAQFLEKRLAEVWAKLNAQPNTYVLPSDEFALLNYYRTRFGDNEIVRHRCSLRAFGALTSVRHRLYINIDFRIGVHRRAKRLGFLRNIPLISELLAFWTTNHHWSVSKTGSDIMSNQQHKNRAAPAWRIGWVLEAGKLENGLLRLVTLFLMLISLSQSTSAFLTTPAQTQSLRSRATSDSSLLECFQVAPPVLSPAGECQQTLMVHTFAFSYGQPFVGNPPSCNFNRATINFTVTSAGRQFDRLALMYFGDSEIFRTSTAEPTQNGIIWSYIKDMSSYLTLFKKQQKIIFDLGNLVDDTYIGLWNTTLTATFFTVADDAIDPADIILPVSARKSAEDSPSAFIVPETRAVNSIILPQNAKKAVFTIAACGQAAEEFWWSNVLQSDTDAFGSDTTLYGHSPFRELRLLIDGYLAGVAWPFPVIFTGGIVPGFWRPVVGIDAFDLREDEIDITPFIPLLSDSNQHTFEIQVVGIDDDGLGTGSITTAIESNWIVTGKIFVWLDASNSSMTGTNPTISAPPPSIHLQSTKHQGANGSVDSLDYSIQVSRRLHIESTLTTSTGPKRVTWTQNLSFSNTGILSNGGNDQTVRQSTSGISSSLSGYSRTFSYPLGVNSTYNAPAGGNLTIDATMGRGKKVLQQSDLAFPNDYKTFDFTRLPSSAPHSNATFTGSDTKDWQEGTASYLSVPAQKKSYGSGTTEQRLSLSAVGGRGPQELYARHVVAANDSLVYDEESLGARLRSVQSMYAAPPVEGDGDVHEFARRGVRALLGRGP